MLHWRMADEFENLADVAWALGFTRACIADAGLVPQSDSCYP
jgi:hypothetical protein